MSVTFIELNQFLCFSLLTLMQIIHLGALRLTVSSHLQTVSRVHTKRHPLNAEAGLRHTNLWGFIVPHSSTL